MGSHSLIISVPLDGQGPTAAHLISATPTEGYNLVTEHAWVGRVDHSHGIEGVLRWPRPADEDQTGFRVLQHARPVNGFTLPATASNTWMLTLILTQRDQQRSMRSTGITAHYTVDGAPHSINLTLGFCFTTPTDTDACPDDATPT